MNKNIEWAQKEVDRYLSYEGVNEARNALVFAKGVINQLDEPEITEEQAWNLISEKYGGENLVELHKKYLDREGYVVKKKEKLYYLRLRDEDLPLYKAYDMKSFKYKLVYSAYHLRNENFLTVTFSESEIENMDIRSFELEEVVEDD